MSAVPTPTELFDSPEFAILAALSATLDAAKASLLAVYPDLFSPEQRSPPGPSYVAWTLITLIRVLSDQIDLYRKLVAEQALPPEDLDIEF